MSYIGSSNGRTSSRWGVGIDRSDIKLQGRHTIINLLQRDLRILWETLLCCIRQHEGFWLLWWRHSRCAVLRIHCRRSTVQFGEKLANAMQCLKEGFGEEGPKWAGGLWYWWWCCSVAMRSASSRKTGKREGSAGSAVSCKRVWCCKVGGTSLELKI